MNDRPSPAGVTRRRRRRLALLIYLGLVAVLLLVTLEGGARLLGCRPYQLSPLKVRVEPGGRFFTPHPALGYTQIPGQFKVILPDGYAFHVTHLSNTLRTAHAPVAPSPARRQPIWVMGCSFVHGWSLNDAETMPWQLQTCLPQYEIHNFGVNGYGTLHSLLQFREWQKTQTKPVCVVVDYAYFHDERNTLIRSRRKEVAPYNQLGPIMLPWARLDRDGQLQIYHTPVTYEPWPLQKRLALVHLVEQNYNAWEDRWIKSQRVSLALLKQFGLDCQTQGVTFVVAGITRGKDTARILQACADAGLHTVDISVNLSEPGSRNLPHDDHPSARSQAIYAQKLAAYLNPLLKEQMIPRP